MHNWYSVLSAQLFGQFTLIDGSPKGTTADPLKVLHVLFVNVCIVIYCGRLEMFLQFGPCGLWCIVLTMQNG